MTRDELDIWLKSDDLPAPTYEDSKEVYCWWGNLYSAVELELTGALVIRLGEKNPWRVEAATIPTANYIVNENPTRWDLKNALAFAGVI